ncbi:hypothetical protein D8B26_005665 [Coccidioides posadasii str. Silveira]|uniref:uncharacterized protein n=1 Tax=Coccidioides posadasii (strain RMSCC 757 / Silveira) TaxID=443226 RepID=UPI001BF06134|nr:hypothetical protein D8B26_005665 [Coccidioides posadasii str. Silveira]
MTKENANARDVGYYVLLHRESWALYWLYVELIREDKPELLISAIEEAPRLPMCANAPCPFEEYRETLTNLMAETRLCWTNGLSPWKWSIYVVMSVEVFPSLNSGFNISSH